MNFGEAFVNCGYLVSAIVIIVILVLMVKEWIRPDREHIADSNWTSD